MLNTKMEVKESGIAHPTDAKIVMPATEIPSWRVSKAMESKVHLNWLIDTWGGLGDIVCSVPVIQFISEQMFSEGIRVTVRTAWPDLFRNLPNVKLIGTSEVLDMNQYYRLFTIHPHTALQWEFMSHMMINSVDFISISLLRMQLPFVHKEIKLPDFELPRYLQDVNFDDCVVVHPGKHWESKTFPTEWWDEVIDGIAKVKTPIIIGKDIEDHQGVINVKPVGLDLRNELTLKHLIALLKRTKTIVTNDSAPMHIACAGDADIYFLATCKHPDYLVHWRKGVLGGKMENLTLDTMWGDFGLNHARPDAVTLDKCSPERMALMLPKPQDVVKKVLGGK